MSQRALLGTRRPIGDGKGAFGSDCRKTKVYCMRSFIVVQGQIYDFRVLTLDLLYLPKNAVLCPWKGWWLAKLEKQLVNCVLFPV